MPGFDKHDLKHLEAVQAGVTYHQHDGYHQAGLPTHPLWKLDGRTLNRLYHYGLIEYKLTEKGQRVLGHLKEAIQAAEAEEASRGQRDGTKAAPIPDQADDLPPAPKRAVIDKADLAKVIARNLGPGGQPQRFLEWANRETTSMADVMKWATERDIQITQIEYNELDPRTR